MWGMISSSAVAACVIWMAAGVVRLIARRGFVPSPLEELSPGARRRVLVAIRYGGLKPEQHEIARRWAVRELSRRDYCWITTAALVAVVFGLGGSTWFSLVVTLVAVVGLVFSLFYLWWDQRAAARLLRGTSPRP